MQVPRELEDKLKCSKCRNFLNAKPINLTSEDLIVCLACYEVLADEIKEKCVRQVGLEKLAESFHFPCKFANFGCNFKFPFDVITSHENKCIYRRRIEEDKRLSYNFNVQKTESKDFLTKKRSEDAEASRMNILLKSSKSIVDTATNLAKKCSTCNVITNIKECTVCTSSIVPASSKVFCKNHGKGCDFLDKYELLVKHEIDCAFNNYRCPLETCDYSNDIFVLQNHFAIVHNDFLLLKNEFGERLDKRDRIWYVKYADNLFVCNYFNYQIFVEFIVKYIGPNDKAKLYRYKVEVDDNKGVKLKKYSHCAGWNNRVLFKGVAFDAQDLRNQINNKLEFYAYVKIFKTNSDSL